MRISPPFFDGNQLFVELNVGNDFILTRFCLVIEGSDRVKVALFDAAGVKIGNTLTFVSVILRLQIFHAKDLSSNISVLT